MSFPLTCSHPLGGSFLSLGERICRGTGRRSVTARFRDCIPFQGGYIRLVTDRVVPASVASPRMFPLPPRFLPPKGPPPLSARERALAQWRGTDLGRLERAARSRARSSGEVMPGVLQHLRIEQRQSETEILKVWNHLLDPNLTAHAQPTGLRHGTLFVTVDSNVWLAEVVRYRRREILDRLQHAFGRDRVRKLSFRVG